MASSLAVKAGAAPAWQLHANELVVCDTILGLPLSAPLLYIPQHKCLAMVVGNAVKLYSK
jgi:hypothetical protein